MTTINRSTRVGVITDQTGAHVLDTEIISGANKMESANRTGPSTTAPPTSAA